MNKVEMVKGSIGLVVSIGVGAIIGNIVKSTSDNNANIFTKVCVMAGGTVLSAIVGKIAVNYTETQVNEIVNQFKNVVSQQAA
jgi:hypothetical protein